MEAITFAAVGAWVWDKYGKSLTDGTSRAIKSKWEKFNWSKAAESYRNKLKKLYGTMQIMGMTEPVPLDDIFTDVYILDKPTALSRFDIEKLKEAATNPDAPIEGKRMNGLRMVVEKGNLFILGKPGAGKTTFLKYLTLKAAEQTINKVPIFITLKHWAESDLDLVAFIVQRFDICGFPDAQTFIEKLLSAGTAMVLFDGLDEVNQQDGQRDLQTSAMREFIEKYDQTQCLITCRLAANDYAFAPFTYVEIADFSENQIKTFVGNWFRDNEGAKDEETSTRFLTEFNKPDNQGLRDLARTPLLLTLLCLAFNETLTFPQRRVEIYQEALDALLKKWDSSRRIKRDEVYRKLSLGHKENMLSRIAADTFEKNEYFIPQAELEKLIIHYVKNVPPHDANERADGEVILKSIAAQHGLFVERARGIYSFSHLTFQEYFTARYIVANLSNGALEDLIRKHSSDQRWHEVFLLLTSLLPDATEFIKTFSRVVAKFPEADGKIGAVLAWADKKASGQQTQRWRITRRYLAIAVNNDHPTSNKLIGTMKFGYFSSEPPNTRFETMASVALYFSENNPGSSLSALNHLKRYEENKLVHELSALDVPTNEASDTDKQVFSARLRNLFRTYLDIGHDWELTPSQQDYFADFLTAGDLLGECLELAYMAPEEKRTVENELYRPSSL
jgi:predicted NACHT family NTPase